MLLHIMQYNDAMKFNQLDNSDSIYMNVIFTQTSRIFSNAFLVLAYKSSSILKSALQKLKKYCMACFQKTNSRGIMCKEQIFLFLLYDTNPGEKQH